MGACAPISAGRLRARLLSLMPSGLKRYYGIGSLHFITWSCYRRRPLLDTERTRDLLLNVLEVMRERYRSGVVGYVVMPEHVQMLISEPQRGDPSTVVQVKGTWKCAASVAVSM